MNYKNEHEFLDDYQTFLQIHALLYHPSTCPYTEPTSLYEEFVLDLLLYIDTMSQEEKQRIEVNQSSFGTIDHMQEMLLRQLERLEEPYEARLRPYHDLEMEETD